MASSLGTEKRWVTDLENQNIDGSRRLRHLLMTCADPIETIKNFQERNSIKVHVKSCTVLIQCFVFIAP